MCVMNESKRNSFSEGERFLLLFRLFTSFPPCKNKRGGGYTSRVF